MAWFLNYYDCERCGGSWKGKWSCTCDDDCPHCGARHMSPTESDDLTHVIEERNGEYFALSSPDTAEHNPDYREVASFPTRQQAMEWLTVNGGENQVG